MQIRDEPSPIRFHESYTHTHTHLKPRSHTPRLNAQGPHAPLQLRTWAQGDAGLGERRVRMADARQVLTRGGVGVYAPKDSRGRCNLDASNDSRNSLRTPRGLPAEGAAECGGVPWHGCQ